MARFANYGPTSVSLGGGNPKNIVIQVPNWGLEYRVLQDDPEKFVMTNITSPTDQPYVVSLGQRSKANIYNGTSINPEYQAGTKSGTDTLIEVRCVAAFGDDADATVPTRHVPMRAALSLSLPDFDAPEMDGMVAELINQLLNVITDVDGSGDTDIATAIRVLRRGVLRRQ